MRLLLGPLCFVLAACSTSDPIPGDECGPNKPCATGFECDPVERRCITIHTGGPKLTVTIEGDGAVSVSGAPAVCSTSSCSFSFNQGTAVTLTAQASLGARFVEWGGACTGTAATTVVTIDAAKSCSARFAERVAVSGAVSGASGASVTASSTDAGATCAGASCTIDKGGSVTLTAPTVTGARFTGWTGAGCAGTGAQLVLAGVTGPLTCTASYTSSGLTVAGQVVGASGAVEARSASPGATCANGSCTLAAGGSVTLTAPAITGQRFTGWSGDPECTGTAVTLTVANVTHDVRCSASYVQRFTVSGTVSGTSGTVAVSSTDTTAVCAADGASCVVDARGRARLEVDPIPGYRFVGWTGGCAGTENPLLVTNVTSDRACVAAFMRQVTVSGTVAGAPAAAVTASSTDAFKDCSAGNACTIDQGGSALLLAPAPGGYRFTGWSGGAGCAGTANPLLVSDVAASTACVAGFVPRVTVTGLVAGAMTTVTATSTAAFSDCSAGTVCRLDAGGAVTLTVAPVTGMTFAGWFGAGCPTSTELSVELSGVTANTICTATFKGRVTITFETLGAQPQQLLVESEAPGSVCDLNTCTVDAGSQVTVTIGSVDAFRFVGWTGSPCAGSGNAQTVTLTVTANSTCTAHYVDFAASAAPVLVNPWPSPTGWRGLEGQPIRMGVEPVSEAVYECRTGRSEVDATSPSFIANRPWLPCDGASGTSTVVLGVPVTDDEDGSYLTVVRMKIVEYTSAEVSHAYYAHESLDGVSRCTPRWSDEVLYSTVKQQNLPGTTAPLRTTVAFDAGVSLELPFLTLIYRGAQYNFLAVPHGPNGDLVPRNPLFQAVLSLRHSFSLSKDRTMLFVKRNHEARRPFVHQGKQSCGNGFEFGWQEMVGVAGCYDNTCTGRPLREMLHCEALVLNSAGEGVCVRPDAFGRPRVAIYSLTAWRKLASGTKGISPKRLTQSCRGTARDCAVSLYLPP